MSSTLTDEQRSAVDAALRGENVRVRAVPGAGKTFYSIHVSHALESTGKIALQLTYSSALKSEWRRKRDARNPHRIDAPHSFHSFAYYIQKKYGFECDATDDGIRQLIQHPPPKFEPMDVVDVILMDETQDCTHLYEKLIRWYAAGCEGRRFQMIVVGQEQQAVYKDGKGGRSVPEDCADLKYLVSDNAFSGVLQTDAWTECYLTCSFRLTPSHAAAINSVFGTNIRGCNVKCVDRRPVHACVNMFDFKFVASYIITFIKRYGASNVQLISSSWKEQGNGNPKHIRNHLAQMGYMFCNSTSSASKSGKILYYTCPGVKGTESMCSIVLGADSFCEHYVCHAAQFVSYTRALEQLVVIQHHENAPWFVSDPELLRDLGFNVDIHTRYFPGDAGDAGDATPIRVCVTDILRSADTLALLMDTQCDHQVVVEGQSAFPIDSTISFGTHTEDLYHISGVSIPFLYAIRRHGVAPDFETVTNYRILVGKGRSGLEAAVTEVSHALSKYNCSFPCKSEFLSQIRSHDLKSDFRLERSIQQHLRVHGMHDIASLVICKTAYARKFPPEKQRMLRQLCDIKCSDWTTEQCVAASLAVNAYDGDHHVFLQVLNYDWVKSQTHVHDFCSSVIDRELKKVDVTSVKWEYNVAHVACSDEAVWTHTDGTHHSAVKLMNTALLRHLKGKSSVSMQTLKSFGVYMSPGSTFQVGKRLFVPNTDNASSGKQYKGSKLAIGSLTGKIDCICESDCESIVLEWKVKSQIGKADRVQLFLYMCLYAASSGKQPREIVGKLVNLRTGEVIHMRLNDSTCAGLVLDAALDLHFDKETPVEDILVRFRCVNSKRAREETCM